MITFNELFDKLNKATFSKVDLTHNFYTLEGEVLRNKIKVSVSPQFAKNQEDIKALPIQLVIRIFINGAHSFTWGTENKQENQKIITWLLHKQAAAESAAIKKAGENQKEAKNIFDSL